MLFKLVNCIPEDYSTDNDRHLALCNILASHGRKNNIVVFDESTYTSIISSGLYIGAYRNFAEDIYDTRREHSGLLKTLSVHAEIDFNEKGVSCREGNKTFILKIGYDLFVDPENAGPTDLLTENGNDFLFYNLISHYYSKHISDEQLTTSFNELLGAGSHCKPEFDRLRKRKKSLLCLIDNDKKHPQKGEGSTSSAFTLSDRSYNDNCLAKVISVREIESLIPVSTIEKVIIKKAPQSINTFDKFKKFHLREPDFKRFFDHKDGLTLKTAIELDLKHGPFWLDILGSDDMFSKKECFKSKECHECNDCPYISGFGDNLLSNFIAEKDNQSIKKFITKLDSNIINDWHEIGHLMMSWGCSGNGRVSRS